jgi:DNA-binding transcriptional regulator YiaG
MIRYPHFAFPNLYLLNGYVETNVDGEIERSYECEEKLEQAIRRIVVRKPERLRGWDLRFLRRGLEISQKEFGKFVDRDEQTVARWEKSSDVIPAPIDLMIRIRFAEKFEPKLTAADLLRCIDGNAAMLPTRIILTLIASEWTFNLASGVSRIYMTTSIESASAPQSFHAKIKTGTLYADFSRELIILGEDSTGGNQFKETDLFALEDYEKISIGSENSPALSQTFLLQ